MGKDLKELEYQEKQYSSYLLAMAFVFLTTMLIILSILAFYYIVTHKQTGGINPDYQLGYCITGAALLLFGALVSIAVACKDYSTDLDSRSDEIHSRSIVVTVLFFSHMFIVALFIALDGGAQASCMSNILLLDAVFGCFFARKVPMKITSMLICLAAYGIVLFLYEENSIINLEIQRGSIESAIGKIPYVFTALFVIGTHAVIYLSQKRKNTKLSEQGDATNSSVSTHKENSPQNSKNESKKNSASYIGSQINITGNVQVGPGSSVGNAVTDGSIESQALGQNTSNMSVESAVEYAKKAIEESNELNPLEKSGLIAAISDAASTDWSDKNRKNECEKRLKSYKSTLEKAPNLIQNLANVAQILSFIALFI